MPASTAFTVRPATVDDVSALAHHRVAMFLDIGNIDPADAPALEHAAAEWMREAIPGGDFLGWVARDGDGAVVGGAGMQLRPIIPRPRPGGGVRAGRQGLLVNVYTERAWRRRGVAEAVVRHAIEDARRLRLASVVLHASREGRPLYERLGFASTDELQLDLDTPVTS
jgi:GNAT superfamily N-acetyltransferase